MKKILTLTFGMKLKGKVQVDPEAGTITGYQLDDVALGSFGKLSPAEEKLLVDLRLAVGFFMGKALIEGAAQASTTQTKQKLGLVK